MPADHTAARARTDLAARAPSARTRSTIRPEGRLFSLLLGLFAALPTFGIDMILPSLPATAATFGASPAEIGLAMSCYLIGLGAALLVYGPVSDRVGRKPIIVFGSLLLAFASLGCAASQSLGQLLAWRALQGVGASGPGMAALVIVSDLFDEAEARARMAMLVLAVNVVPMVAPLVGAALLRLGSWRIIHAPPAMAAVILLIAMIWFPEPLRPNPAARLTPASLARDYLRVLLHPTALGHILCNAAAAGAVFAYITGSSLFFIGVLKFTPVQYGLTFGASSLSVMAGTLLYRRLSAQGVTGTWMTMLGLALLVLASAALGVRHGGDPETGAAVVAAMVTVALAFGVISPNAVHGAQQALPDVPGAASATLIFMQLAASSVASGIVASLFDGRSAASMAIVVAISTGAACTVFLILGPGRRGVSAR